MSSINPENTPKKQIRTPSKDHVFQKRLPQKPQTGKTVLYVSTKSNTKGLLDRCSKLINENENEITLYCMGAAIQRGILLALQLCEKYPTFKVHTNTLTTELIDDLEPATDEADYEIQRRNNSALKIKLFRSDPIEAKPSTS